MVPARSLPGRAAPALCLVGALVLAAAPVTADTGRCGDGRPDPGEECDVGTPYNACCRDCRLQPVGTACGGLAGRDCFRCDSDGACRDQEPNGTTCTVPDRFVEWYPGRRGTCQWGACRVARERPAVCRYDSGQECWSFRWDPVPITLRFELGHARFACDAAVPTGRVDRLIATAERWCVFAGDAERVGREIARARVELRRLVARARRLAWPACREAALADLRAADEAAACLQAAFPWP